MYIGTTINDSATIAAKASATITKGAMLAVTMGATGVTVAGKGKEAVGLLAADTAPSVATGEDVTVQVKDIGLWVSGGEITAGALLASDAHGKAAAAASTDFIVAQALEGATGADQPIHVQIIKAGYQKA